jgi:curved DNA-binding protein CbpA
MIPLPVEETQKSLFGLLSTGVIEYAAGQRRKRDAAAPAVAPREAQRPATAEPAPAPQTQTQTKAPPPQPQPAPVAAAPDAVPPPPPPPAAAAAPLDQKAEERRLEIMAAWEGLATRNHFEVLGLERAVGEAEVKEAYFGLAKRFHPDVHHGASLGDLRDKLEAVFIRLGEAYDTLRDPKRRGEYEERLGRFKSRPAQIPPPGQASGPAAAPEEPPPPRDPEEESRLAEEALRKAAKLLEHAKNLEQEKPDEPEHQRFTYDAIQLLEPILDVVQGKPRLRAQLLLARGYSKNPKWAKRAEELLLDASRENPQAPEPCALLGAIYAARGLRTRAVSMYKKALELKPDHEEAFRYLAENAGPEPTPPEDEGGGGGLFGRLFRKG